MIEPLSVKLSSDQFMQRELDNVLEMNKQKGYPEAVQEILNLDISILAKYLFISENQDGAEKTIGKLSVLQKVELLKEVKQINQENNSGRTWMFNHIEKLCS